MRKRFQKTGSLLLALTLLLALALPAQAADVRLSWQKNGSGALLTLRGMGEASVYGVQMEMTVAGSYTSASFAPSAADAYSECRVSALDGSTQIGRAHV